MAAGLDSRQSIDIPIRKDLLNAPIELNIDLVRERERCLEARIKATRAKRWLANNQEAIAAYNSHVEEHGVWNESFRLW